MPFADLVAYRRRPLSFLTGLHQQYGDIARFQLTQIDAYLVSHPDYIRDLLTQHAPVTTKSLVLQRARSLLGEGLLTSEPPRHTRQRRLIQPAFHRNRLHEYGTVMSQAGERLLRRWRGGHLHGQQLDLHEELMQLTLQIVVKALFTEDLQELARDLTQITGLLVGMFPLLTLPFSEHIERWPLPVSRRFRAARDRLDALIYGLIERRRNAAVPEQDLLSTLLAAQDDEDGSGAGMSDRQVRDELITLFLAGHETTANALTWTFYLLTQSPEAEAKLLNELNTVLNGRIPEADDLDRLAYTRAVLSESMRLFPPVWVISRVTIQPVQFGSYEVPARSLCLCSQWVTHRDARFFHEPLRFVPERWLLESDVPPRWAFFPFGGGSRICVGERFAWMEGTLLLALIAQKWRFRLAPGAQVEPAPLITLRPRFGLPVVAEHR